jgi:dynein regulatry complex protein 1
MLNDHEFKLKELFESHSKTEMQIANSRKANEEKNAREIEGIRINFQKAYADKKIRSENDIQNLEMCLEDMRALYLLNSEKLDYNFKVLKEKDDENTQLTGILKNKKRHHTRRLKIAMDDYAAVHSHNFV